MATIKELKELALHSVRGTAPENYTVGTVDEALRGEIAAMCDSVNNFMRNRYDIYDVIIKTGGVYNYRYVCVILFLCEGVRK